MYNAVQLYESLLGKCVSREKGCCDEDNRNFGLSWDGRGITRSATSLLMEHPHTTHTVMGQELVYLIDNCKTFRWRVTNQFPATVELNSNATRSTCDHRSLKDNIWLYQFIGSRRFRFLFKQKIEA